MNSGWSVWFKCIAVVFFIALAGTIISGFGYMSETAQLAHLTWCNSIEGGMNTYMYGTSCPNAYVSMDDVAVAQGTVSSFVAMFWICLVVVLGAAANLVLIVVSWLREDYGSVTYGIEQRRFDKRFVRIVKRQLLDLHFSEDKLSVTTELSALRSNIANGQGWAILVHSCLFVMLHKSYSCSFIFLPAHQNTATR